MDSFVQVNIITHLNLNFEKIGDLFNLTFNVLKTVQYYGLTPPLFVLAVLVNLKFTIKKLDSLNLLAVIILGILGYIAMLNQFELKADSFENIVNYSGKRFFFGFIFLMWFYIATNGASVWAFDKIHKWLSFK